MLKSKLFGHDLGFEAKGFGLGLATQGAWPCIYLVALLTSL